MKYLIVLLIAVSFIGERRLSAELSTEEIITNARKFLGGESALNGIQTIKYVGSYQYEKAVKDETTGEEKGVPAQARLTALYKKPLKQRLVLEFDSYTETRAVNDYEGWKRGDKKENSDEWTMYILMPEELKRMRSNTFENLNFYANVDKMRAKVINHGRKKLDGQDVYELEFRYSDSIYYKRFFDVETFKLIATQHDNGVLIKEFGEIVVNGVRFPKKLDSMKDGKLLTSVEFEKIEVNSAMDDSLFQMPSFVPGQGGGTPKLEGISDDESDNAAGDLTQP